MQKINWKPFGDALILQRPPEYDEDLRNSIIGGGSEMVLDLRDLYVDYLNIRDLLSRVFEMGVTHVTICTRFHLGSDESLVSALLRGLTGAHELVNIKDFLYERGYRVNIQIHAPDEIRDIVLP